MKITDTHIKKITSLLQGGEVLSSSQIAAEINMTTKQTAVLLQKMRSDNLIDCYCDKRTHVYMWFMGHSENLKELINHHEYNATIRQQEIMDKFEEMFLRDSNLIEQATTCISLRSSKEEEILAEVHEIKGMLLKLVQFSEVKV